MNKIALFNGVMTLLVIIGLLFGGLYYFGDSHDPDGLRQVFFEPAGQEQEASEPVAKKKKNLEVPDKKVPEKEPEQKTETVQEQAPVAEEPIKKEETVVEEQPAKEQEVKEEPKEPVGRDEKVDAELAKMSTKDLKNLRVDTKQYLDELNVVEGAKPKSISPKNFVRYVPLDDSVIKELAEPFALYLEAAYNLKKLQKDDKFAEAVNMPRCKKCNNEYVYPCPKCTKKKSSVELKGLGGTNVSLGKGGVCTLCDGSKTVTCDVCLKYLDNKIRAHRTPLRKEIEAMLKKISAAYNKSREKDANLEKEKRAQNEKERQKKQEEKKRKKRGQKNK